MSFPQPTCSRCNVWIMCRQSSCFELDNRNCTCIVHSWPFQKPLAQPNQTDIEAGTDGDHANNWQPLPEGPEQGKKEIFARTKAITRGKGTLLCREIKRPPVVITGLHHATACKADEFTATNNFSLVYAMVPHARPRPNMLKKEHNYYARRISGKTSIICQRLSKICKKICQNMPKYAQHKQKV